MKASGQKISFGETIRSALAAENIHCKVFTIAVVITFWSVLLKGYGVERQGTASWYGGRERLNKYTASGERFDSTALTCASWHYPFGTRLKVTNVYNERSVVVRVNDRGPARRLRRLIDLSKRAFGSIAPLKAGLIKVKIEVVT